jgi:electron transport complex protein RnfG
MREMIRYGIILSIICAVASGLLAGVNFLTKSKIIAQEQNEQENSLQEVMPEGRDFEAVKSNGEVIYYKAYDKDKRLVGIAFQASAKGYSSDIVSMVGLTKEGEITAIKILSQNETPGLGARVAEPAFVGQFAHKNIPGLGEVQAITGATISSKAVIYAVKKKAQELQEEIKNAS